VTVAPMAGVHIGDTQTNQGRHSATISNTRSSVPIRLML